MKTLKCPICGSKRTFLDIIPQGYQYICTQCGLCALRQFTPQEAAEAWNELVSKFPPIMRVWPGDKLQVEDGSICEVINVNKNLAMMDVRRGEGKPVFTIADTHVIRWPWELEQEGGTEQ